nr:hypothetical protein CQW23_14492 [Ipomoea batatas]
MAGLWARDDWGEAPTTRRLQVATCSWNPRPDFYRGPPRLPLDSVPVRDPRPTVSSPQVEFNTKFGRWGIGVRSSTPRTPEDQSMNEESNEEQKHNWLVIVMAAKFLTGGATPKASAPFHPLVIRNRGSRGPEKPVALSRLCIPEPLGSRNRSKHSVLRWALLLRCFRGSGDPPPHLASPGGVTVGTHNWLHQRCVLRGRPLVLGKVLSMLPNAAHRIWTELSHARSEPMPARTALMGRTANPWNILTSPRWRRADIEVPNLPVRCELLWKIRPVIPE